MLHWRARFQIEWNEYYDKSGIHADIESLGQDVINGWRNADHQRAGWQQTLHAALKNLDHAVVELAMPYQIEMFFKQRVYRRPWQAIWQQGIGDTWQEKIVTRVQEAEVYMLAHLQPADEQERQAIRLMTRQFMWKSLSAETGGTNILRSLGSAVAIE